MDIILKKESCYAEIQLCTYRRRRNPNAAKILAVMSLGAKQGQTVEFTIEGEDEVQAAAELEAFMKANL